MSLVTKPWHPKTGITLRVYSIGFDVKSILENVFATKVRRKFLIESPHSLIDIRVTNTPIYIQKGTMCISIYGTTFSLTLLELKHRKWCKQIVFRLSRASFKLCHVYSLSRKIRRLEEPLYCDRERDVRRDH